MERKQPSRWDIFFYFLTLIFCYFVFNHADILSPAGSSFTYLSGHVKDFYGANSKDFVNNYLPSSYILFAVWNLPLRLLGVIGTSAVDAGYLIFWYKLLPTLFLAASGLWMYRIGRVIGLSGENSRLMTMLWLSSPILFFGQFIFGQIDIFTVFFTLIGFYYLLQKKTGLFIFFFSISFTFKYFPLFIFVPLLLLVEKRPLRLFIYLFLALVPVGAETLFYGNSLDFVSKVVGFAGAAPRLFQAYLGVFPAVGIHLFPFVWFVICGICYYLSVPESKEDFYQVACYICLAVLCALFILILWHPQWLVILTPFLTINLFMNKRIKCFLFLEFIMMFAFVGYNSSYFRMNVDQQLFSKGVLGSLNPSLFIPREAIKMSTIFSPVQPDFAYFWNIYFTLICAILLIFVLFNFPFKWNAWKGNDRIVPAGEYWNYARLRFFGGLAVFIIPAFFVYFYTLSRYR
ncbi:MAG: hypothetical protein WC442_07045 [Candidatus Omnitrophota bacterium]